MYFDLDKALIEYGLKLIKVLSKENGQYTLKVIDCGDVYRTIQAMVVVDLDKGDLYLDIVE